MKCINKMRLLCLCGIAAVFMSGCGQTVVSYDNPYDIYSTSADYGLASEGAGSEKTGRTAWNRMLCGTAQGYSVGYCKEILYNCG